MTLHSLMIASALAMVLAVPAMAQSSTMHRYVFFFKYSDAAVNEMTENPQDRKATLAKLYEIGRRQDGERLLVPDWGPIRRNGNRPIPGRCERGSD